MKKVFVPLAITKYQQNIKINIYYARETLIKKVLKYDNFPLFVSTLSKLDDLRQIYELCDKVMLLGGWGINPNHYNSKFRLNPDYTNDLNDEVELQIAKWAIEDKKPILGFCRGSQIINIALGGSLKRIPTPHNHHSASMDKSIKTKKIFHNVQIDLNTKLGKLIDQANVTVNSYHKMQVSDLGNNLQIVGKSDDNVIELFESKIDQNIIGIQSHPEKMEESDLEIILRYFFGL